MDIVSLNSEPLGDDDAEDELEIEGDCAKTEYSKVQDENYEFSKGLIEPKCMELGSALAAGKKAKLMVEVTTEGITPLTLALAAAAKQIGGQLICIFTFDPNTDLDLNLISEESRQFLRRHDLEDAVRFLHCGIGDLSEVMVKLKDVDFAVVDGKLEDCLRLFESIDMNSSGCSVVVHNLHCRKNRVSYDQVVKRRKGVEAVMLPIGEGIELTRIGSPPNTHNKSGNRKQRRFHVTFENNQTLET